jgi:hypothetical protein
MNIEERNQRSGGYSRIKKTLDYSMGTLYTLAGIMVLTAKMYKLQWALPVPPLVVGSVLIIYGLFRLYRAFKYS